MTLFNKYLHWPFFKVNINIYCFIEFVVADMDSMPAEVLSYILEMLQGTDRLAASFTCQRWLSLLSKCLPRCIQVCINLDASYCHTCLSHSSGGETTVNICICDAHIRTHANELSSFFQCIGDDLRSLIIDDDLIPQVFIYIYMPRVC